MSNLSIGIFDSGIGGLTVARAVHQFLPNESIMYFGDTAHLPYGDKSPELLRKYIKEIVDFLLEKNVKALVIACNTASAVAFDLVQEMAKPLKVFEVVQPAVNEAVKLTKNQRIGVIGTKTTILSHIYLRKILDSLPSAFVVEKATPILVPMIEEGWIHGKISKEIIEAYLSDTGFTHIDSLILGCTHYPLIRLEIEQYFENSALHKVHVIDSSITIAKEIKQYFLDSQLLSDNSTPENQFYVSDLTLNFQDSATLFFGKDIHLEKISLS